MRKSNREMRLRPYRNEDFVYIKTWAVDKRTHFFWCADRVSFPAAADEFHVLLAEHERLYGAWAYCYVDEKDIPKAFCVYLENEENEGFIKFVIVDNMCRGCGYGTGFMKTLLKTAFENPVITAVRLNVIDVNEAAKKCYQNAGFAEKNHYPKVRQFEDEKLGIYSMIAYRPGRHQ